MKAVVLVGGFGTRLRPLTETRPKQMLPILNRPMIEHVIDHLAAYGIDEAVLSMGYRPDAFGDAYPDGECNGVALTYAIEPEPLDTAGAIGFAARFAGIDERFVVVNGDILTDLDLSALIAFHDAHGGEGTIALHQVEDPSAFGVVPTDDDGRVLAFVEKPPRDEAPTDLINAGTYVLEPSVLDRIEQGRKVSIEREVFPAMVADGALFAMAGDTYWIDTGTHAKYLSSQLDLLDGVRGEPVDGVAADAAVDPGATIERSVIGAGATIADGATVLGSIVLPGARVGAGAVIDGSIVGVDAAVGAGARVESLSVLGDRSVVGPDAHLVGVVVEVGARWATEERGGVMRALVTGGAGFIGSTLVDRLLAEGHEVDVVDDLSTGSLANLADARATPDHRFTFHQLDIRDAAVSDLIERRAPEVVFHLAAQIDVRVSVADPALDAAINVLGSINVLEGARRAGSRKVVFASSGGTIYGEPPEDELPYAESCPQQPVSPYGVAKKVVSDYLFAYRRLYDLEFTSLALANVYGPRQDPHGEAGVVAIFAGRLLAGEPCTIFGDGSATRDYVFVDDVVDAFVRAADKGSGLVLNVGTGVETSTGELYATMARVAQVDRAAVLAPARDGEVARSALDAGRAEIHLGWKPWTDLATGTKAVLDYFQARSVT